MDQTQSQTQSQIGTLGNLANLSPPRLVRQRGHFFHTVPAIHLKESKNSSNGSCAKHMTRWLCSDPSRSILLVFPMDGEPFDKNPAQLMLCDSTETMRIQCKSRRDGLGLEFSLLVPPSFELPLPIAPDDMAGAIKYAQSIVIDGEHQGPVAVLGVDSNPYACETIEDFCKWLVGIGMDNPC